MHTDMDVDIDTDIDMDEYIDAVSRYAPLFEEQPLIDLPLLHTCCLCHPKASLMQRPLCHLGCAPFGLKARYPIAHSSCPKTKNCEPGMPSVVQSCGMSTS